jgi:hypothetical protein
MFDENTAVHLDATGTTHLSSGWIWGFLGRTDKPIPQNVHKISVCNSTIDSFVKILMRLERQVQISAMRKAGCTSSGLIDSPSIVQGA